MTQLTDLNPDGRLLGPGRSWEEEGRGATGGQSCRTGGDGPHLQVDPSNATRD